MLHDASDGCDAPKFRPLERFWPYAELPEQPTDEELAALDPDLQEALFGSTPAAVLDHAGVSRSSMCPSSSARCSLRGSRRNSAKAAPVRCIATAPASGRATRPNLRALFQIVGVADATEVLIDDRPVPYARELWLPLVWLVLAR